MGPLEDAAVLRPAEGTALVFTVDFITPIVDDPETYGAIAVANALSDIYAMGGEPQAALAICGFPSDTLPREILTRIFRGGRDKAAEARCAIVGGHTVTDEELKYGLCVLGSVDPHNVLTQRRAEVGDILVLTKPIGTGIASQAIKQEQLPAQEVDEVVRLMAMLNKGAKDAAIAGGVRAATDVTGFGFLGHVRHLVLGAGVAARVRVASVPVLDFARSLAEAGLTPGGTRKNLEYVEPYCAWGEGIDTVDRLILADAQTSGGLLLSVPPESLEKLLQLLERYGAPVQAVVGEVIAGKAGGMEIVAE